MARYFSFRWMRIAAVALVAMVGANTAQAQFVCSDHDDLVARLAEAFQEKRIGYGLAGDAAIIEVFVSASGTWTMLMTDVRGRSCIVAAGDGWESIGAVAVSGRDT